MMRRQHLLQMLVVLCAVGAVDAQQPDAAQIAQERSQAELDAPKLVEVLELKPGMTVADVGSGFGAMTVVLGHWIGSGHVFATDITEHALRQTREFVKKEALTNVTVIEGAEAATNLPDGCCDAIFLRNVYHHITAVDAFNRSLVASLNLADGWPSSTSRIAAEVGFPRVCPPIGATWRPAGHRGRRTQSREPHSHQNGRNMAARGADLSALFRKQDPVRKPITQFHQRHRATDFRQFLDAVDSAVPRHLDVHRCDICG